MVHSQDSIKMVKVHRLSARWSKRECDILYSWGSGVSKADAALLHHTLTSKHHMPMDDTWAPGFIEELEARGYDLTTLRFSIDKKKS